MCEDGYLLISGLQHFEFCKRQWALIHIEQQWQENFLTADGRVMHSRVHGENVRDFRNGVLTVIRRSEAYRHVRRGRIHTVGQRYYSERILWILDGSSR